MPDITQTFGDSFYAVEMEFAYVRRRFLRLESGTKRSLESQTLGARIDCGKQSSNETSNE